MKIAGMFPGQGAQYVGMLSGFADHALVRQTFEAGSEVLGVDLWQMSQRGPAELLSLTVNTQPLMLLSAVSCYRAWRAAGGCELSIAAGHSLGEFSAYVAAGLLDLGDAVHLVRRRAELMQGCVAVGRGAMAAVIGLSATEVDRICRECAAEGWRVEAVNFNEPGQTTIAGLAQAVAEARLRCQRQGARRVIALNVSVPFHTSLLEPAGEALRDELAALALGEPAFAVVNNVDGGVRETKREIIDALARQAYSPVRWMACMQQLGNAGASLAVEFGPGSTLAGFARKTGVDFKAISVCDAASLATAIEAQQRLACAGQSLAA